MKISTAKKQVLQSIAGAFPCNAVLHKWGRVPSAACALCGHPAETQNHIIKCLCRVGIAGEGLFLSSPLHRFRHEAINFVPNCHIGAYSFVNQFVNYFQVVRFHDASDTTAGNFTDSQLMPIGRALFNFVLYHICFVSVISQDKLFSFSDLCS
jgi:hypothetical protein